MRKAVAIAAALALGAPSARGATLEELLARNLEARGGRERIAALRSLQLTGKIVFGESDGFELAWTKLVKRPGMIRAEGSVQGLTAIRAFDGRGGWQVNPFFGRREPDRLASDDAKPLARDADLDGPLVAAKEQGNVLAYLGTEDVDGTEAHKIQVTRPDGDVEYVYLDPDRFLEIRVETRRRVRGVEVIEERDLGSYEPVEGVLLPFSIEAGPKGGARNQRITVLRAAGNVPLDDALFAFPAGAQPAPIPPPPA
ncbi:MAG TPA: hypothetical protein VIV57_14350, partial [Anaeromyxobacter sp.]